MRTSNPHIFCVGDAAELPGALSGLWSVGSEQGKIVADAMFDGDSRYRVHSMPPVQLKVAGINLKSFGSLDDKGSQSLTEGDVTKHTWKHLCVKDGKLLGGVFVNSPLAAVAAIQASQNSNHRITTLEIRDILHKDN